MIGATCAIGSLMIGNSSNAQTFSGQFNNQTAYHWPAAHPDNTKVFSGDYNGDGYGDVGLGDPNDGGVLYIKYGDGTGQFPDQTQTTFSWPALGSGSGQPFSVDINGDGYSDIGLYNPNGLGNFYFRYGDGTGDFKAQTSYPWKAAKPENTKVFTGDFNGDGWGDIGLYNPNGGYAFYIQYGNGSGVDFSENPQTMYTWVAANIKETQVISGDFDGNGYGDIGLFNPNKGGGFYIKYGNGSGAFSTEKPQTLYTWVSVGKAFSADYNGDGYRDIGLYNPNGGGNFFIQYAVPAIDHISNACNENIATSASQSIDRRVTACTGTWSVPGIRTAATAQQPSVAANLCGSGYRVCKKDQVATCVGISNKAPGFFAADQSSNGGAICTSTGANDLFGCGLSGNKPTSSCSPLNKTSGNLCNTIPGQGWNCGTNGAAEFDNVTKTAGSGGVLCCPIENGEIAWAPSQSDVYQISSDMAGKVETKHNMTVAMAKAHADSRDVISSFYLVGGDYTGSDLKLGDAVFFAGIPKTVSTTGVSLYEKHSSAVLRHALKKMYAYYSFDMNANDNSNSGHNGTQNFATLYQDGYRGNAIRFPAGTDAQVTFPSYSNSSEGKFSISLWVKPAAGMKVGMTNGKASILGPLYFDINSNKIKYDVLADGATTSLTSATAINIGQWTHVNVTKDDLRVTLLINGHVAARENNITGVANPFGSTIGGIPATVNPPNASFVGAVDEVLLFTDYLNIDDINIFAGTRKSERGIRNDRGFSTQSSSNDGQPGYKARAVCRSSPWGFCLEYAYSCSGNELTRDRICGCPLGTAPKSPAGTGCTAATTPPPPPAKMTINNLSEGYNKKIGKKWIPKEILVSNASRASFQGTGKSAVTNKVLIERFSSVPTITKNPKKIITAMCKQEKDRKAAGKPASPFVTPSFTTACDKIENKMEAPYRCSGNKTNDLNISMKLPPSYTVEVQMDFPKLNVQEWGNLFLDHNPGIKDFIVVNTNFWEMTDTPPCGSPLGYYKGDGATESTNQTEVYDSLVISLDQNNRKNKFHFFKSGLIPASYLNSHVIASGVLLRHNGAPIPVTTQMPSNAKADEPVGRTAIGHSSAYDELKIIVIPKYTPNNNLMKTAAETLAMFDDKYENVILFDGGGSATLAHWKDRRQIFKIGDPQKSAYQAGLNLRSIPVALVIAVPSN